jgi:hypothetical protein
LICQTTSNQNVETYKYNKKMVWIRDVEILKKKKHIDISNQYCVIICISYNLTIHLDEYPVQGDQLVSKA